MSEYKAPLRDMHFVLQEMAGLAEVAKLPGFEEINAELVDQILEESAKFARGVLSPLNKPADKEGSKWEKGKVTTRKGFREATRQFVEAGWNALQAPAEYGGQGLPKIVSTPVVEMWKSANLSFSLGTMLTAGAVEALILRGTEEQKKQYLPKMIEGSWTGTMNLTEPQAGSDLALVRTKAVREGDHYRVSGQKIFITYGEHDLAENIVHLVLGRVEGAPEGVRGISLFLVPKFLVNADGSPGQRNEVQCASILRSEEHTSELQSRSDLVCRLLLDKKKQLSYAVFCLKKKIFPYTTFFRSYRIRRDLISHNDHIYTDQVFMPTPMYSATPIIIARSR